MQIILFSYCTSYSEITSVVISAGFNQREGPPAFIICLIIPHFSTQFKVYFAAHPGKKGDLYNSIDKDKENTPNKDKELKVKESNRIDVVVNNLKAMGADIEATDDGMIIHGGQPLHDAVIDSHLDHRIAMSFTIAGSLCGGATNIKGGDCVNISYPSFYEDFYHLSN